MDGIFGSWPTIDWLEDKSMEHLSGDWVVKAPGGARHPGIRS